jgi:hypothetical protein
MRVLIYNVNEKNEKVHYEATFNENEDQLIRLWEMNIFPFKDEDLQQVDIKPIQETFSIYDAIIFKPMPIYNTLCIRKYNSCHRLGSTKKIVTELIPLPFIFDKLM